VEDPGEVMKGNEERSRERRARERREGGERRLGREAERMTGKPVARSVDCETQHINGGDTSTHHSLCLCVSCTASYLLQRCEVDQRTRKPPQASELRLCAVGV